MSDEEGEILAYALLWLRNHYDVGDPGLKKKVLGRIDRILRDHPPSMNGGAAMRKRYPTKGLR